MSGPLQDPYWSEGSTPSEPSVAPPAKVSTRPARRGGTRALSLLLVALIGVNLALLGILGFRVYKEQRIDADAQTNVPKIELTLAPPAAEPLPTGLSEAETRTIGIFRNAAPSVVFITTMTVRHDPFRRDVTTIPAGTGSGFMWDDQGHIVTNYHVIRGGQAARVTLADQSSFTAKLVGTAPDKDLAVLKIDAPAAKLRPLPRGTAKTLVVGQQALAIGNPFGLDHTLSTGVVSGLNREIKSLANRPIIGVIQTDAAINPGNSGGPLLDSQGRLIGINTAIYSPSGASAGIGFAVPVDIAERIIPQLILHGKVIRPGIGIRFDPDLQRRANIKGVLVLGVTEGSPAHKAGIQPTTRDGRSGNLVLGDIIVGIDGKTITDEDDLFKALDEKKVGDKIVVKLKRGERTVDVDIELAELEEP